MRKEQNTIKIKEDVRIPGTDIILEEGDRIEILKESRLLYSAIAEVETLLYEITQKTAGNPVDTAFSFVSGIETFMETSEEEYGIDFANTFLEVLKNRVENI